MEIFVVLFIVVLGLIVIGSIMGMTASGRISKLEQQNRNLNARLKILESREIPEPKPIQIDETTAAVPVPNPIRKPVPEMGLQAPRVAAATATAIKAAPVETSPDIPAGGTSSPDTSAPQTPSSTPPMSSKPAKPARNLEELIGAQWSVWVGGFALLVGALLLIRFSIEAGFFGPGARITMAYVLGAALLFGGEWFKRSDDKILSGKLGRGKLGKATKTLQGNASVPGLLSAIGIFTLLGTTYAAHELYGFISAPVAFIGLGVIALGAMALSLRQGPLLAAIGLLASIATPLLIQTETPNFMALVGYLLVIGLAALYLARQTGWRWLETGVVFGWLFWLFMSLRAATGGQLPLWSAFLALGFGVTVWLSTGKTPSTVQSNKKPSYETVDLGLQPILAIVWGVIAAVLIGHIVTILHTHADGVPLHAMVLAIVSLLALCGSAVVRPRQCGHLMTAGLLAVSLGLLSGPASQIIVFAIAVLVVVGLSIREAFFRDVHPITKQPDVIWPVFAIGLGLLGLIASHSLGSTKWTENIYSACAFGYATLFAATAFYFQTKSRPKLITACFTVGAALAWALAAIYGFGGLGFSSVTASGAALMVAAIAILRLPGARISLLGLTGLVFAHAFWVQFPDANSLSARPIFNALWVYLALPTAILGAAGYLLHGEKTETKQDSFLNGLIEAAALAGLALFAVFQIRHLSNEGAVYVGKIGFTELGLQVSTGLCFTLAGLSKRFVGNLVLSKMAEIISYATLAIFAFGSLVGLSPMFNGSENVTGNILFNALTTGLLVPTFLLGLCAWRARGRRPDIYINLLGGLGLAGAISWVTAMIRFLYNGGSINIFETRFGDMELWTISAVWLAFGIALLALGIWRRERALRIASAVLIILTVLKAFLIDMAGLEGVLRALSFVVLGLVLIVIGRAYQRYWLSDGIDTQEKGEAV